MFTKKKYRLLFVVFVAAAWLGACAQDDSDVSVARVQSLVDSVSQDSYLGDLIFIAQERAAGSAHHQAVRDFCAARLEQLGFSVERQSYGTGVNVIGTLEGAGAPQEIVLAAAHYDHIQGCPGADDDATGVAGVLELARVLAANRFQRTLVVAFWDEEEKGLLGSLKYAARARERSMDIHAVYNLDMIGFTSSVPGSQRIPEEIAAFFPQQRAEIAANGDRADFITLLYDESGSQAAVDEFNAMARRQDLRTLSMGIPASYMRTQAAYLYRSDHTSFWLNGYPAIMINDTAELRYPAYHCRQGTDVYTNLDHDFAAKVIRSIVSSAATMLRPIS
jgi:Zn-dependent M28 family amino/carboxypeptidase